MVGSNRDCKNNNGDGDAGSKLVKSEVNSRHVYNLDHIY